MLAVITDAARAALTLTSATKDPSLSPADVAKAVKECDQLRQASGEALIIWWLCLRLDGVMGLEQAREKFMSEVHV